MIDSDHLHYTQALKLRHRLLRAPLGLDFTEQELASDVDAVHAIALEGDAVVGCASALPYGEAIKIRQMAVDPAYQGRGIGSALVKFLEEHYVQMGHHYFVLSARQHAIPFYVRNGYEVCGEMFLQVGIEHFAMRKQL